MKEKKTAHRRQRTVRISEGSFLIQSVDWTIQKCPLSTITGVCIKWLELKGYKGFPQGQKKMSVITWFPY